MNKKILVFLYYKNKLLLLKKNPEKKLSDKNQWFTVTGSVEKDELLEKAVRREIKEETNLDVLEIFNLNWKSIYSWMNGEHSENNFLAFIKEGKIILNEEHSDYEWLSLDNFIKKVNWGLDKEELRKVLQKAIKKELHFNKEKIDDFRIK